MTNTPNPTPAQIEARITARLDELNTPAVPVHEVIEIIADALGIDALGVIDAMIDNLDLTERDERMIADIVWQGTDSPTELHAIREALALGEELREATANE